ncbi:MAG: DUF5118 domain-containing protein, partial [Mucinivorans sp.]
MKHTPKTIFTILMVALLTGMTSLDVISASPKKDAKVRKGKKGEVVVDSTAKPKKAAPAPGTVEFVINKPSAIRRDGGMVSIIEQEGKYYFLMPTSVLGRDILVVNRLAQGAAGVRTPMASYAGDQIG